MHKRGERVAQGCESMEDIKVKEFLSIGYGFGSGSGDRHGFMYGFGDGSGFNFLDNDGYRKEDTG